MRPRRRQPTRLLRPWDSPGKNTGVGCHFLLQCMKVKSESEVAQSCPALSDPMDCSLPGSSVHGIFHRHPGWPHYCPPVAYESKGLLWHLLTCHPAPPHTRRHASLLHSLFPSRSALPARGTSWPPAPSSILPASLSRVPPYPSHLLISLLNSRRQRAVAAGRWMGRVRV